MAGLGRRSHYRKHLTNSILNDFPEPVPPNERIAKVVGTRGSNQFEVVLAPEQEEANTVVTIGNRNEKWNRVPQLALLPSKFRKLVWVKRNDYVICSCAVKDEEEDECIRVDGNDRYTNNDDVSPQTKSTSELQGMTKSKIPPSTLPGGIRYMITHILYKDQVKHLKDVHKWPTDPFFGDKAFDVDVGGSVKKKVEDDIIIQAKASAITHKKENRRREMISSIAAADDIRTDGDNKEEIRGTDHDEYLNADHFDTPTRHQEDEDEDEEEYEDEYVYEDAIFINTNRIAKMTIDDSSSEESD